MENWKITALAVMDLLAIFDKVLHDGLIEVLKCKSGLEGTALQWIKNTSGQGSSRFASTMNTQKQNTYM